MGAMNRLKIWLAYNKLTVQGKIILYLIFFLSIFFFSIAYADPLLTVSPTNPSTGGTSITFTYSSAGGTRGFDLFRADGTNCNWDNGGTVTTSLTAQCAGAPPDGALHILYIDYSLITLCGGFSYSTCKASAAYITVGEEVTINLGPPPPPPPLGEDFTPTGIISTIPRFIAPNFTVVTGYSATSGIGFMQQAVIMPWWVIVFSFVQNHQKIISWFVLAVILLFPLSALKYFLSKDKMR